MAETGSLVPTDEFVASCARGSGVCSAADFLEIYARPVRLTFAVDRAWPMPTRLPYLAAAEPSDSDDDDDAEEVLLAGAT